MKGEAVSLKHTIDDELDFSDSATLARWCTISPIDDDTAVDVHDPYGADFEARYELMPHYGRYKHRADESLYQLLETGVESPTSEDWLKAA